MNKRGLSNVIIAVFLVLLAIIAVMIIWSYLKVTITTSSEEAQMKSKCMNTAAEIKDCKWAKLEDTYITTALIKFTQGEPTELMVVYFSKDKTKTKTVYQDPLNIFETRKILPLAGLDFRPHYAIISPIIKNNDKTKNITCEFFAQTECTEEKLEGNLCEIPTFVEDVNAFVLAKSSPNSYNLKYPDCPIINTDFNCDDTPDFNKDLNYFKKFLEDENLKWYFCNRSMICIDSAQAQQGKNCWENSTWCDRNCRLN